MGTSSRYDLRPRDSTILPTVDERAEIVRAARKKGGKRAAITYRRKQIESLIAQRQS